MPEPADPVEPGLHLVMGEAGTILRSAPIRKVDRRVLQPPLLRGARLDRVAGSASELVLDVLSDDGRVLDSFGWSWVAEAFYDRPLPKVRRVPVGRVVSRHPLRVLRVPVRTSATFLLFSRLDGTLGTDLIPRAVIEIALTLYSLVSRPPSPRPILPAFAGGLTVEPLPGNTPLVTLP